MSQAQVVSPSGSSPSSVVHLRALGLAREQLGVVEVGFGRAVWLRITPAAQGVRVLDRDAIALRMRETGQVPEIEVENRGADLLLVPAHVVLTGGWQTRAVERSVLIGSGIAARVPVKCVEAGRWAPRDDRTATTFQMAERTGMRTRWSSTRSMTEQLRWSGRYAAEQAAIWQHVDEELTRSPLGSRTRSYEAFLRGVKEPFLAEARRAGVRPAAGANAVALLPRGGGFWLEAYPTEGALAANVDDLLADLFDPEAKPGDAGNDHDPVRLLDEIWSAPLCGIDRVPGTAGEAHAFTGDAAAAGALLCLEGALAHLAVGAAPGHVKPVTSSGVLRSTRAAGDPGPTRENDRVAPSGSARALEASEGDAPDRPRVDTQTMAAVFARARDLMPEEPPARERVQGYRLVRVLDRSISWVDVRITGDGYAVLGSHDRCDLVLGGDPGIWLRHMAAICVRLDDGSVGLRLIDLKTDLPFFLDDSTPRWSVLADGPFAMRIARHVICGFPIGALAGDEPSAEQRPPTPAQRRDHDVAATGVLETVATRGVGEGNVVPVRAAAELTSFVPSASVADVPAPVPAEPGSEVRVTLERGGMGASVELPADALDSGVLLGRALNCFDGGLRRIFCEAISRAHVLLLRDHGEVYAFDLCSTNGTRVAGQRIRRYRLPETGATLELGKKVVFRWRR